MGQGYTRNDTANNIADGNVIDAVDLDGEFDAIVAAFHASTGHTHDGTSAEGAPINVMGPAQEFLVDGTAIYPKTDNTYDLGKAAALIRALYATTAIVSVAQVTTLKANDGTAAGSIADSTGVVTLASAVLTTADINGGTMDSVTIGATTPAAVTTSSLVATTADINGGTIDATTIGATTPAAGSFTDVNATGTVDGRDVATDGTKLDTVETNADVTDTANVTAAGALMDSELASVAAVKATTGTFLTADQSKLDGIEALADVTDVTNVTAAGALMDSELDSIASVKALDQGVATTDSPTFAGATLTTADINGGTIDGTVIGGTTPAAGTFTALTSTGIDDNAAATAVTIDSSGNVLVGTTDENVVSSSTSGITLRGPLGIRNSTVMDLNRLSTDGEVLRFRKDGTTVGSIGSRTGGADLEIDTAGSSGRLSAGGTGVMGWNTSLAIFPHADNVSDVGTSGNRWDDIYATNGTIQTSDRNEKQDIAALTATEMLVAARISGLFKTFRWIDSVADKGDDARTHTGIIAQDVQGAFAAEGLDAGNYSMFTSATWWTHDVDVPAVEAVAAYTRTDTYDTLEEAPDGATERTRLGVRYPELLAFVAAYNDQRFLAIEAQNAAFETRLAALEAV